MSKYKNCDNLEVTEDEATEQLAWALMQASIFFQNTPEDFEATKCEVLRIITTRGNSATGPWATAARAFLEASNQWFENDKKKFG